MLIILLAETCCLVLVVIWNDGQSGFKISHAAV